MTTESDGSSIPEGALTALSVFSSIVGATIRLYARQALAAAQAAAAEATAAGASAEAALAAGEAAASSAEAAGLGITLGVDLPAAVISAILGTPAAASTDLAAGMLASGAIDAAVDSMVGALIVSGVFAHPPGQLSGPYAPVVWFRAFDHIHVEMIKSIGSVRCMAGLWFTKVRGGDAVGRPKKRVGLSR